MISKLIAFTRIFVFIPAFLFGSAWAKYNEDLLVTLFFAWFFWMALTYLPKVAEERNKAMGKYLISFD